ncbi:MAG: acylphosphatase [Saprospiraceae bacterium]|nr:acylphosphatase [Saprospiraceae bacterium]
MDCIAITVSGKVQGVFYRASLRAKAMDLSLSGIVMNRPDGTVYAEVEGLPGDIDLLIQWCERGPEEAIVYKVETKPVKPKYYFGFEIKR